MCRVCNVLSDCWDLPVLCDCLSAGKPCNGACMQPMLRILGLTIHLHSGLLCYPTPSALTRSWQLKWGPSLHSPWAMQTGSLANIFTGALINAMPFQFSWACFLLTVSTWMQVATLCNHPISVILCAIKIAIRKCCSRAAWCVDASIQWAVVQSHHLPTTPADKGYLLHVG